MTSTISSIAVLVAGLAALGWILVRQRRTRRATTRLLLPALLAVVGLTGLGNPASGVTVTLQKVLLLVALLLGDAVILGIVRALTVRLWVEDGSVWRRGTWLTLGLWAAGAAVHVAFDLLVSLGSSSLLLYLGVTWIAQRLTIARRIRNLSRLPGT